MNVNRILREFNSVKYKEDNDNEKKYTPDYDASELDIFVVNQENHEPKSVLTLPVAFSKHFHNLQYWHRLLLQLT